MRTRRLRWFVVIGALLALAGTACDTAGGGPSTIVDYLAPVLRFPVIQDPKTWDPALIDAEADSDLMQNVFDGLWRFDDKLNIIPAIAPDVPSVSNGEVSTDGLTYRVHLKHNVSFSNGDALTSKDVVYSWNRSVALRGTHSGNLARIAGYAAVVTAATTLHVANNAAFRTAVEQKLATGDPSFHMSGLEAPDEYTVRITLSSPCGWCLAAWSLPASAASIVDERVIQSDPVDWWSKPSGPGVAGGLVGTGAYYLSSYVPTRSITFRPVLAWWDSPKPIVPEVDIDIRDSSTQSADIAAWERGSYDVVGYGGDNTLPLADILRIKRNRSESSQLLLQPTGRTTWVRFNIGDPSTGGPFVGETAAARGLRLAFALAVDKNALVSAVCHDLLCIAATGGIISKGLVGYGGDGSDPLARFDPNMARSLLHQYDPTGTLTANLKYAFITCCTNGDINNAVAKFLMIQWQANLGVTVAPAPQLDGSAFNADRQSSEVMVEDSWQLNYDHPQDWYDNLWGSLATAANAGGYADRVHDPNPAYDTTLARADSEPVGDALPLYDQLARMLRRDAVYIPLYYSQGEFLVHPWVKGAGSNAQADFYWDEISFLPH